MSKKGSSALAYVWISTGVGTDCALEGDCERTGFDRGCKRHIDCLNVEALRTVVREGVFC
jgi:hypothetical protein